MAASSTTDVQVANFYRVTLEGKFVFNYLCCGFKKLSLVFFDLNALCRQVSQAVLSFLFVAVSTPTGGIHTHTMSVEGCHSPNHELVGQFISQTLDRVELPVGALQFRMYQELETIVSGCFMVSIYIFFYSVVCLVPILVFI